MTMFDDRERAFEAKWAHDEEMQFRITIRRNQLLGRWAAEEMGLAGAELEHYVAELVAIGLKSNDADMLFKRLRADLGAAHSDAIILRQMDAFLQVASLDAGLEQRRSLVEDAQPHRLGQSDGTQVDFSQIFPGEDAASAGPPDETHIRVGRGVAIHALGRARRNQGSR